MQYITENEVFLKPTPFPSFAVRFDDKMQVSELRFQAMEDRAIRYLYSATLLLSRFIGQQNLYVPCWCFQTGLSAWLFHNTYQRIVSDNQTSNKAEEQSIDGVRDK